MSGNKRHLSDNPAAVHMREKRHRDEQEKEMLKNEVDSLKKKITNLESIINLAKSECTCGAGDRAGKKLGHGSVNENNKNKNGAAFKAHFIGHSLRKFRLCGAVIRILCNGCQDCNEFIIND